jgi:hypothetical protein
VRPGDWRLPVSHSDTPPPWLIIYIRRKIVTTLELFGIFGMRDSSALGLVIIPATVFYAQDYLLPYHEHWTLFTSSNYALDNFTDPI